jgi:ribosomal protein S16
MRKAGSKKRPFFRVVVTDRERIGYWVGKGAKLSDTVRTLLARHVTAPAAEASSSAVTP